MVFNNLIPECHLFLLQTNQIKSQDSLSKLTEVTVNMVAMDSNHLRPNLKLKLNNLTVAIVKVNLLLMGTANLCKDMDSQCKVMGSLSKATEVLNHKCSQANNQVWECLNNLVCPNSLAWDNPNSTKDTDNTTNSKTNMEVMAKDHNNDD